MAAAEPGRTTPLPSSLSCSLRKLMLRSSAVSRMPRGLPPSPAHSRPFPVGVAVTAVVAARCTCALLFPLRGVMRVAMARAAVLAPWPAVAPSSSASRGALRGVAPTLDNDAAAGGLATATGVLQIGQTPCRRSHSSTQLVSLSWA